MSVDQVTAYAVELRLYKDQATVKTPGKYLEIPVPECLADFDGVKPGEKSFYAHLENGQEFSYLRFSVEDRNPRHHLKLKDKNRGNTNLAVSLPTEFAVHNDRSPFRGVSAGDSVNIEIREEDNEFRLFRTEDFPYRVKELSKEGTLTDFDKRFVAPVLATGTDFTDLTVSSDVQSQEFEIVPFDGQHQSFVEIAEESQRMPTQLRMTTGDVFRGSPKLLDAVKQGFGLPIIEADIKVKWSPEAQPRITGGGNLIYTEENATSAKVELQENGSYSLLAEQDGDGGSVWLAPDPDLALTDPIRENWSAFLYEDQEGWEAPKIYVPVGIGEQKGHWPSY